MKSKSTFLMLIFIFLLALILRFLYFPENIYFGFDQARDAFAALALLQGDLRFVGPPTGVEGLFHGPLYYYLYAPLYLIFKGDPAAVSALLRVVNAAAIFLIFFTGGVIFNYRTGLIAAFLFAISFEQTQYSLYFNHPSLAVLSVTLFYLGLGLLFFKKKPKGLIVAVLGLGLSLQFEFVLIYLFPVLVAMIVAFRNYLPGIQKGILLKSLAVFLITVSTFILAEIKFNFRAFNNLTSIIQATGEGVGVFGYLNNLYLLGERFVGDNLLFHSYGTVVLLVLLLLISIYILVKNREQRTKIVFLLIWIVGGILPYLNNKSATPLYYYSVGASVGLLILSSFYISELMKKFKALAFLLLLIPVVSNWNLITHYNPQGVIPTINVQSGMLLGDEKKIVDFIYRKSDNQHFAVRALTMPLSINTTWSYLFQWYGINTYGYLPVWVGPNALGFAGNLKVVDARSELPEIQFLIIEPTRGIRQGLIDNFMTEEGYFTKVVEEKRIGDFFVQVRKKI